MKKKNILKKLRVISWVAREKCFHLSADAAAANKQQFERTHKTARQ
jgi:hypothetical protein